MEISKLIQYAVVGMVRSTEREEELKMLHGQYNDLFSYAVVPDILKASEPFDVSSSI